MSFRRYNKPVPVEKVSDPTIPARLDKLLAGELNTWERAFCTSIKQGFEKYKSLTAGQNNTLLSVESRHTEADITARDEWNKNFTEEKRANWNLMAKYYSRTPYYKGAVERWNNDKAYIPSEKEYESICQNVYAQRMIKHTATPPKFAVGSLVVMHLWSTYRLAMVVEVGEVQLPVKGSREYKLILMGSGQTDRILEKSLLYYRPSLDAKLSVADVDI